MTPDPKLLEAVARAIYEHIDARARPEDQEPWEQAGEFWRGVYCDEAGAALAAISASGEWWVAPWRVTEDMERAAFQNAEFDDRGLTLDDYHDQPAKAFAAMRDAYLKDMGTGDAE